MEADLGSFSALRFRNRTQRQDDESKGKIETCCVVASDNGTHKGDGNQPPYSMVIKKPSIDHTSKENGTQNRQGVGVGNCHFHVCLCLFVTIKINGSC